MTFLTIVLRDLWRRPVRTGLTLAGIAIGIAAVVALVGMSSGYEKSTAKQLDVIGTDIIVSNVEGGIMPKAFDESISREVSAVPGVELSSNVLMQMLSVEDAPMIMVSGREWGGFTWSKVKILDGRMPNDGQEKAVILGRLAADILKKKVGDKVFIEIDEFDVVGIFDGGSVIENGAIILSLPLFQEVTGYEEKVNFINIKVAEGSSKEEIAALCDKIEEQFPQQRALPSGEVVGTSMIFKILRGMSWSTSLLAIIVGVLGVMNTMLMSVFERTHEIGILLALGWKRLRVMLLILTESAILGLIGGILGIGLGALTLAYLETTPAVKGLLEPDLGMELVLRAIFIAVVVGILSGLYPAWRSSRLSPSVALQG